MNGRRSLVFAALVGAALFMAASASFAQGVPTAETQQVPADGMTLGKIFTFLFLTLGPFNLLGPFSSMTRGRDDAFKRRLAVQGTAVAAVALAFAATLGARTLRDWGVSTEALLLTVGIILFLVALRLVLQQYEPPKSPTEASPSAPVPDVSALAFFPLAFPTIATPYGLGVLVVLLRLRESNTVVAEILALTAIVLLADLLAMLFQDRILKFRLVGSSVAIAGAVMGVLQISLAIEVMVFALRRMGVMPPGGG
jgi:multiple antibiotic resistance protein